MCKSKYYFSISNNKLEKIYKRISNRDESRHLQPLILSRKNTENRRIAFEPVIVRIPRTRRILKYNFGNCYELSNFATP